MKTQSDHNGQKSLEDTDIHIKKFQEFILNLSNITYYALQLIKSEVIQLYNLKINRLCVQCTYKEFKYELNCMHKQVSIAQNLIVKFIYWCTDSDYTRDYTRCC